MASVYALKSWYSSLPKDTKLKIYGIGTVIAVGGLILRRYIKTKKQNDVIQVNNNNQSVGTDIIIPISGHKVFWGSYILSGCTLGLLFSSRFASFCNEYIPRIMKHKFSKSLNDLLPPIPKTLSESFKLGQLEKELTRLEGLNGSNWNDINKLLSAATELLRLKSMINAEQLHGILGRIISIETQKTTMQRIGGIFKFVNIMWGLSILGISATIIPVLYYVAKPVWDEIFNFFKKFLTKLGSILYKVLFNETAYTIYEILGYGISWYFVYLGLESNGNSTIGFFVSLTGLSLWMPMFYISLQRHEYDINTQQRINDDIVAPMTGLIISTLTAPIAYKFNSNRLGLLSIGSLYYYLCSVIYGMGKVHIIEDIFDGDMSGAGIMTSLIFNTGLIILKLKKHNMDLTRYEMFIEPTCIVGCIGIYSALLSYSYEYGLFWYNRNRNRSIDYWQRQYTMITSLLLGMGVGNTLNLPAMSNTAFIYSGLYILQKLIEYEQIWKGNVYFTIFGSSIVTWRIALYLHKNPQIFANMMKFE